MSFLPFSANLTWTHEDVHRLPISGCPANKVPIFKAANAREILPWVVFVHIVMYLHPACNAMYVYLHCVCVFCQSAASLCACVNASSVHAFVRSLSILGSVPAAGIKGVAAAGVTQFVRRRCVVSLCSSRLSLSLLASRATCSNSITEDRAHYKAFCLPSSYLFQDCFNIDL